ncbi:glycosyl hydrolase family 61-domain-containing protein [Mycena sp. CBHHK59/15]|nr:glycosyl hydrolase family 61-domain-containing protein [Mycena sp. CBHHK59/15]
MRSFSALLAVAALAAKASGHYIWPSLIVGGANTSEWQYVRETNNWQDLNPLTNVNLTDVRCYDSTQSGTASTMSVTAGSTVGFTVSGNPANLYHPGVLNVYMAKAPSGTDVAGWDGSGDVWFRIYQITAVTDGGSTITFPATGMSEVTFPIPAETPSGQYLIRIEHIALHVASSYGGAQFYIACSQVDVRGTGTPGPLVSFPGAYTVRPSPSIDIYYPIPATYTQPGPALWPASGSVSSYLNRIPFSPSSILQCPSLARHPRPQRPCPLPPHLPPRPRPSHLPRRRPRPRPARPPRHPPAHPSSRSAAGRGGLGRLRGAFILSVLFQCSCSDLEWDLCAIRMIVSRRTPARPRIVRLSSFGAVCQLLTNCAIWYTEYYSQCL